MTRASRLRRLIGRVRNLLAAVIMDPAARRSLAREATPPGVVDFGTDAAIERARLAGFSPEEAAEGIGRAMAQAFLPVNNLGLSEPSETMWRQDGSGGFPHCDQRVLHAPGRCEHCDLFPVAQALRKAWGIAYTGQLPERGVARADASGRAWHLLASSDRPAVVLPCPADFARPRGSESDPRRWAGNVASSESPVNETGASRILYGQGDRDS